MGAESRVDFIKAAGDRDTARAAYERATYEAQCDNGSRGYTGSIAEANGFVATHHAPVLKWEAQQIGDRMIRDGKVEKWGSCAMIAVAEPTAVRTIELVVDVTGVNDWQKVNDMCTSAVRTKMQQGEQIEELRIEDGKSEFKVTATSTEGRALTRYSIRDGNQWRHFDTLTAAKKWATEALQRNRWQEQFNIIKTTVRESGEPLTVVRRVPTKVTKKVTAKVGKPGSGTAGWMACGVYSC